MLLVGHEHRRLERSLERLLRVADHADDFHQGRAVGALGRTGRRAELRTRADRAAGRAAEEALHERFVDDGDGWRSVAITSREPAPGNERNTERAEVPVADRAIAREDVLLRPLRRPAGDVEVDRRAVAR